MSKIHRPGDEYELGPATPDQVAFRHYRNGQCIGTGVATRGSEGLAPGTEVLDLGPPGAEGRCPVKQHIVINAQGSICHSGVATPEYRDGWDRIFADRKKPTAAKAN